MTPTSIAQPLKDHVAVITGASKGLGRAIAVALADVGVNLALISRGADRLGETAEAARKFGVAAEEIVADISVESEVQEATERIRERFGKVHILINNAGINIRKNATEFTLEEWNRVLNTNLTGAFLMCRSIVPLMKGHGYGRIINMTSMMSHVSLPGRTAYSASKAGLLGFTKALALELASDGITVNGISPGPCATEMNLPLLNNPELNQQFVSRIPLGRWGKVEEVARCVLYICSRDSGFLTGTDIVIDGGWTAQ
jgi:NAD(P)-dependent dehydrogenase (short-subunit alcohol dehydrogenase family)